MSSQDLAHLRELLFQESYSILKIELKIDNQNKTNKSIFSLKKGVEELVFESSEIDVLLYGSTFHRTLDPDGKWVFISYKDNEKYYRDIDTLIDRDGAKRRAAFDKIIKGNYQPKYDPEELIRKFLLSKKRSNPRFEPLKTDYFEILIGQALIASDYSKMDAKLQSEREIYSDLTKATRKILSKTFQNRGNAVENFLAYHKYIDIEIEDITKKIQDEKEYHKELYSSLAKQGPSVNIKIVGKAPLDIYRRYSELSSQFINALRISIELGEGLERVLPYKKFADNIGIIKSFPEYSVLVDNIDPRIRHSESHINTEIDEKTSIIRITERKHRQRVVLCEYPLNEISKMILSLDRDFFPAMALTFTIFEATLFLQVLDSFEYKNLLLGIGNIR